VVVKKHKPLKLDATDSACLCGSPCWLSGQDSSPIPTHRDKVGAAGAHFLAGRKGVGVQGHLHMYVVCAKHLRHVAASAGRALSVASCC